MSATGRNALYLLGVDLGQAADPTALAVLKRTGDLPAPGSWPITQLHAPASSPDWMGQWFKELRERHEPSQTIPPPVYHCGHLERLSLGTSYVTVVATVADLLARPPLRGCTQLVLDATGVGKPVRDMFVARGLRPLPITIHGGDAVSHDPPGFRVPKRDLIQVVQVLLQQQRLKFAGALPSAPALVEELQNYQVEVSASGHDSYNARSGKHDDLILAVAVAAWLAERWWAPARAPAASTRAPWPATRMY